MRWCSDLWRFYDRHRIGADRIFGLAHAVVEKAALLRDDPFFFHVGVALSLRLLGIIGVGEDSAHGGLVTMP